MFNYLKPLAEIETYGLKMKITVVSASAITLQECNSHCAYCGIDFPILIGEECILVKATTPLGEQEFYVKMDHKELHNLPDLT